MIHQHFNDEFPALAEVEPEIAVALGNLLE
jgi:hypothetical protein